MTGSDPSHERLGPYGRLPLPLASAIGFAIAFAAVVTIGVLFNRSLHDGTESANQVTHTLSVLELLERVQSSVTDAETGQRGYLLSGDEAYLAPYNNAAADVGSAISLLKQLSADSPAEEARLGFLDGLITSKLQELEESIKLARDGNPQAAVALLRTDRGRLIMVRIRAVVADIVHDERALLTARQERLTITTRDSLLLVLGASLVLIALIAAAAVFSMRQHRSRELETWLRSGQLRLADSLQGERRVESLARDSLTYIARYVGSPIGTLHIPIGDGSLRQVADYAIPDDQTMSRISPASGLVGQAAQDKEVLHVRDVPADYLRVSSSLGSAAARELIIAPAVADGTTKAVLELGFFTPVKRWAQEFIARVSEPIAVAVRTAEDRSRLETLLEETQRQSEELQTQQEELRVSNEELEEQGHALRESTVRLEEQRSELEQNNAQLEEQAEALAAQKHALQIAQAGLRSRAEDLENANRYKSEFLANMSHELRTPLNSTLILSKLLADNKTGTLSGDQVKYAQTIYAAGNDLLTLINDILDLSKIEARKVDLDVQPTNIRQLAESLRASLEPVASEKGLTFEIEIAKDVPAVATTDGQRLAQILRNLLSNAIKFTDKGSVTLDISLGDADLIAFAIRDTGIGIPLDQQEIIFEAFRQADGTTHRTHGGTGLGLSISRNLAILLGGAITVRSAPGSGSAFTLTIPRLLPKDDGNHVDEASTASATRQAFGRANKEVPNEDDGNINQASVLRHIDDDRALLSPGSRRLLIVEDDPHFAAVLRDLGRELGYQTIAAATASEGLSAAREFQPTAAVLDINLPDQSGLALLDRLKRDPKLRAMPVHITSIIDYARVALERGAIGYDIKPVSRERLIDALKQLEDRAQRTLRHILIVEDDQRQRESIRHLLTMDDVEIAEARTAGEALASIRAKQFDCVVLDLNLPDVSGERLLEQMANQTANPPPPVIVYTGRSLTEGEEQSLRRFADSIIVKGARSPERLLDEVTLFLHQVDSKLPPEAQRMLQAVRGRDERLERRRILVAEDDVRNVFALTSVLEPYGVTVQIVRTGVEAVAALVAVERGIAPAIDMILMDIMMPELDGLGAIRAIRSRPVFRRIPILALTAKAMPDDQQVCLAAGASDYIAKPLDADKLISLIRVWMPKLEP